MAATRLQFRAIWRSRLLSPLTGAFAFLRGPMTPFWLVLGFFALVVLLCWLLFKYT